MNIRFHKRFIKDLKKRSKKEQELVRERMALFLLDPFHPQLRNHPLKGVFQGYRSIDIRPNLRALYKETEAQEAVFVTLGSHEQLYR